MAFSGSVTNSAFSAEEKLSERDIDWGIVQRVQAGKVGAFDFLVQKYREHIFSVIYNMTSNREDASDLTQETFIKAFQAIGRFKGKSS
ncbi:MAG: sigma factor, partial [Verrucomicrobiota bacterium]|nr:sigma factor [Verrucomicrobiota bacterium]